MNPKNMSKSTPTSSSETADGDDDIARSHIGHSTFWNRVCHDVFGPSQGGCKIMFDAEDAALGVGKTSGAVALGRQLAKAFGYELEKDDFTLSAAEYMSRFSEHPGPGQPSVLLLDEAVGGGAGDSRRAMSQKNVDLSSAFQTMRAKRVVTIMTTAHFGELDPRLKRLTDYRVHCSKQPIGQYRPYEIGVGFGDGKVRMRTLDSAIHFPDMSGDPFYEALAEMKTELLDADTWDADDLSAPEGEDDDSLDPDEAARQELVNTAERALKNGHSQDEVADIIGKSQSWVSRNTDTNGADS